MKSILKDNIPNELYQSVVILYGAGITCRRLLELLKPYPIDVKYILDDDMNKWGNKILSIEIISYQEFEEICRHSNRVAVILTTIYGKTAIKKLSKLSNIEIYEMYGWLDEVYGVNSLVNGMNDKNEIEKFGKETSLLKQNLEDEESQKVLEGLYAYICSKDSNIISDICTGYEQYFIPEVLEAVREPLKIVDGGAYVGELYQTIRKHNLELERWYCFEADIDNYNKLLRQSARNGLNEVQVCIKKGLWDKEGVLYFDGEKDTVSRIVDYKTDKQIETVSLNTFFRDKSCNFIKMDIEGAEYPALCGGIEIIKRDRPILAISIYHSLKDYYRIPNYLMHELHDYKYYIRQHALILSETVLYAIPNELVNEKKQRRTYGSN